MDKTGRNAAHFFPRIFWGNSICEILPIRPFSPRIFVAISFMKILWIKQGEMLPVFFQKKFGAIRFMRFCG